MRFSGPSPKAHQRAVEALASWVACPWRAGARREAARALGTLIRAQRALDVGSSEELREPLLHSYAALDAENLRDALLQKLVGPGWPAELLVGFPWVFGTDADRLPAGELIAAVRTYAEDLLGDDFDPGREEICRPDEVVLESGRIVVVGCAYPPSGSPRLFLATLESDDGRSFRAGELMAKLVGPVGDALRGSVHRAFRGLRLKDRVGQPGPSVPLYEVLLSSDRNPPDGPPTIGWERLRDLDRWRADRCGARAGHRPA